MQPCALLAPLQVALIIQLLQVQIWDENGKAVGSKVVEKKLVESQDTSERGCTELIEGDFVTKSDYCGKYNTPAVRLDR